MRPLIPVLAGPTGSGKTALVCALDASVFEVVACDSRQVYAEMPVGTAAPTELELQTIAHHLVGIIRPNQELTAGSYRTLALDAISDILARGRVPIVVAGTGFYYMALKRGMFPTPSDPMVKQSVEAMSAQERLDQLRSLDPVAFSSGRIHPNDEYRIRRALEITISSGAPWSTHWARAETEGLEDGPYRFAGFRLEPGKEPLVSRLQDRARSMILRGFVEEAVRIREEYGPCPGLRAIGYDLALECADGRLTREAMQAELARRHWQYARKQMTWFRREKELSLIEPEGFATALRRLLEGRS